MQGTRNESIPPNPKTRLPHDVNPHTRKACNVGFRTTERKHQNFNPRTTGKLRLVEVQALYGYALFQSTHPGRGATFRNCEISFVNNYFNPRTPGGVRQNDNPNPAHQDAISIHAPRAGCDKCEHYCFNMSGISIHAPRAGCDF